MYLPYHLTYRHPSLLAKWILSISPKISGNNSNFSYLKRKHHQNSLELRKNSPNVGISYLRRSCSHLSDKERKSEKYLENIYTIPNGLCLLRILAAPLIAHTISSQMYTGSFVLFIIAGFTDLIDGLIARRIKGQKSKLGSILDPLADKILVSTLFISLSLMDRIPVWLTVIIISRDVILIMASAFLRYKSLSSPRTLMRFFDPQAVTLEMYPSVISKINTALQLSLIGFTLAEPLFSFESHSFLKYFQFIVALSTVCSGVQYTLTRNSYKFINHRNS